MHGVVLAALGAAACGDATDPREVVGPPPEVPPPEVPSAEVQVTAITATMLTGTVATAAQPVPMVRATDEHGTPLPGVVITVRPASGSGTIPDSSITTGADGSATVGAWTLGPLPGSQTLTASVGEQAGVVFTATAGPGPLAHLTPVSGDNQILGVGQILPERLVARATDAFENPLAGIPVVFSVILGGGSIEGAEAVTDAAGLATSGTWALGPEAGEQRARAAAMGVLGDFRAFAVPPPRPFEGGIAFESSAEPDIDIAIVNADGSGFTRLVSPWVELQPAWSPDGSRLAIVYDSPADQAVSLYIRTAEAGGLSRVTQGPRDTDPAWSPDGSRIAFSTFRDGSAQIAALDLATRTTTVLVDDRGYDGQPSWSPDGRRLAFVSDYDAYDFVFDIYLVNADGTGRTQLTYGFDVLDRLKYYLHPAWSPDGRLIAFVIGSYIRNRDMRFQVAVMSPDGTILKELAWAGDVPWNEVQDPGSLTWSPDGSVIAYSFTGCDLLGDLGCPGTRSVRYVALDGSREGTIVTNARNPSWSR